VGAQPDATIASISRLLGVSRATIYKYVPELKTGQRPQLEAGAQAARAEPPPADRDDPYLAFRRSFGSPGP
jgi:transposase-like protein